QAWVNQTGQMGDAYVNQYRTRDALAVINDSGERNDSVIEQNNSSNVNAFITQSGYKGDAYINQYKSMGSTASITDSGKYDNGVIDQWNVSNSNASIVQGGGHKNDATISQTGTWWGNSDRLHASIVQSGSHNKAVTEQTGYSNDS